MPTPEQSSGGIRNQSLSSVAQQQALPTSNGTAAELTLPQVKSGRQQPLSTANSQHRAVGIDASSAAAPPVRGKMLYSQDLLSREQYKRAAERATKLLRERGQAGAHAAAAAVKEALSVMGLELAATRV